MVDDFRRVADALGRALAEGADPATLITLAITRSRELLDAEGVVVLLLDRETDELYFPAMAECAPVRGAHLDMRFPRDRGIAGTVLRTGKSVRVDDASADAGLLPEVDFQTGRPVRALLCVPLIVGQRVIGVMQAVNLFGAAVFREDDQASLEAIAGWLADAIEHSSLRPPVTTEVGMREFARDADATPPPAPATEPLVRPEATAAPADSGDIFRKEGEYWTIAFQGRVARLRDAKGLQYIAYLLRHPGREFHVTELMALVGDAGSQGTSGAVGDALRVSDLGDAGVVLDAQAKAEYKRRLDDLRAELEEAEQFNDSGRAARARQEIEFLNEQLSSAVGLGGRDRVVASGAERARLAVTKRIKAALGKVRNANPALGRHLSDAITTGYFCSYTPRGDAPVSWSVE